MTREEKLIFLYDAFYKKLGKTADLFFDEKRIKLLAKEAESTLNKVVENIKPLSNKIVEQALNFITKVAPAISEKGGSKLHYDVIINNPKLLMKDLSLGMDPDIQGKEEGFTPLHLAAFEGKKDLVELLLKYRADPNILSYEDNYTALHAASVCKDQDNAFEVAKLLLRYGARTDLIDDQDNKAYDHALNNNENIAGMLKSTEASKDIWSGYHKIIKSDELPGIDIVELRHALNNNRFDVVYKLSEENHIDYHEVADWAKYHNYEDKVGSILSMCEHTHHHEL
ncbi:ankyrin repeat domain-containing protein [Holosporaceae bacterium 'Namur']|nr:ankyrin repeat domain-containing protein [Holosporaceae bacterium 'Namur']